MILKKILKKIFPISIRNNIVLFRHEGIKGVCYNIKKHFVKQSKIISPIKNIDELLQCVYSCKSNSIEGEQELINAVKQGKELVLLVSHELALTGAPIALYYFAQTLKKQEKHPVIISPFDGPLKNKLSIEGITTIVYPTIYESYFIKRIVNLFSLIIANTIVCGPVIKLLSGVEKNILWWIHESAEVYKDKKYLKDIPKKICSNINIYCVNDYADKMLKLYRPDFNTKRLFYYVPDFSKNLEKNNISFNTDGKIIFAIVGTLEERKAQNILCRAIDVIPEPLRNKSFFYFVGKKASSKIWDDVQKLCNKYPNTVTYIEQLQREEMFKLYMNINCLISTSIDDPMPIVITEAMIASKTIICSDTCGTASMLKKYDAGLVYHDFNNLVEFIEKVIKNDTDLKKYEKNSRSVYERFFTQKIFETNISEIYKELSTRIE